MEGPLAGSIAIVTGASRGLGRAFALDLAECGAALALVARNGDDLADTANAVRDRAEARTRTCRAIACHEVVENGRDAWAKNQSAAGLRGPRRRGCDG